ncbi:MAG: DUF1285 domain-containing protein [Desulfobacteraceae bacterium]
MQENNIPPCMIFIDKDGKWFHKGIEMIHKGIVNEFYRSLTIDSCGEYLITLGEEKCFVEVEDTPFIVTRIEYGDTKKSLEKRIILYLIDGTQENLAPDTLSVGNENVLYCKIKNNTKARFSRAAYYQLASYIKEEGDKYYLPLHDKKYHVKI